MMLASWQLQIINIIEGNLSAQCIEEENANFYCLGSRFTPRRVNLWDRFNIKLVGILDQIVQDYRGVSFLMHRGIFFFAERQTQTNSNFLIV